MILLVPSAAGITGNQASGTDNHQDRIRRGADITDIHGLTISSIGRREKRAWSPFQRAWRSISKSSIFASKTRETDFGRFKTYLKVGTYKDAFADFKSLVTEIRPHADEGYYGRAGNDIYVSLYNPSIRGDLFSGSNARLVLREGSERKIEITVDYIEKDDAHDSINALEDTLDWD